MARARAGLKPAPTVSRTGHRVDARAFISVFVRHHTRLGALFPLVLSPSYKLRSRRSEAKSKDAKCVPRLGALFPLVLSPSASSGQA